MYEKTYYPRKQRWELRYQLADGTPKTYHPTSEEKKEQALATCKANGYRVISCKKLYPFNTEKNQHNFDLIHNICMNAIFDMDSGETPLQRRRVRAAAGDEGKGRALLLPPASRSLAPLGGAERSEGAGNRRHPPQAGGLHRSRTA